MINDFLARYDKDLIDKNTKRVTEQVTEQVTKTVTDNVTRKIAKNLKDILPDVEIAKRTGLPIQEVQKL